MALLEDLKVAAGDEQYPKSLTLRAVAEIKELRTSLGIALVALEQADVLLIALRDDDDKRRDMLRELNGELNLTEPKVRQGIKVAKDTLRFGL